MKPQPSGLVLVKTHRFASVYQMEGDSENRAVIGGDEQCGYWQVNIQRLVNGYWKADAPYNRQPRFSSLAEAEIAAAKLISREDS